MHDPRLGRFLSLDPLSKMYPHNSPYAFAENRVIDGVELEGLEYKNYIINYTDLTKPLIYEETNSQVDYRGLSIQVHYHHAYTNQSMIYSYAIKRDASIRVGTWDIAYFDYGLYYGPTGLNTPSVDYHHDLVGSPAYISFDNEYWYGPKAIDAVDYGAKIHDMAYDAIGAVGGGSLIFDLGATPADIAALRAFEAVRDDPDGIDDRTGLPIGDDEREAATVGARLFSWTSSTKIFLISRFIETHHKNNTSAPTGETILDNTRENYQLFLNLYMEFTTIEVEGETHTILKRKEENWILNDDGTYTPNPIIQEE
jgi:hypothetical protein